MKSILVIEDTSEVREEICDILQMEGYNTYWAVNGAEGLQLAKEKLPDLVVTDILMPVMDGYQFFRELKKYNATQNIPVIFLSAKASKQDIRNGMNLGADDYLIKPLSPEDLLISIKNKLSKVEKYQKKLDTLRANISYFLPHELKTPLNGILGFADYLKDKTPDMSRNEIAEIAEYIYQSGVRLQRVVENYALYTDLNLSLNNPEKLKDFKNIPFLETKKIILKIVNDKVNKAYRENDLDINVEDEEIFIDEYYFSKILEELIDNAIKFSVSGNKIKLSAKTENEQYRISLYNEGSGITIEQIANIVAFMQFDRQKNEQQGVGLGLAIVQLIAKLYNAQLEIESKPEVYFLVSVVFNLK